MTLRGTFKNGVLVLEAGATLPEGTCVNVEPDLALEQTSAGSPAPEDDPLWQIPDLAVDTGIPDLAVNLDHYLYGHPKVTDGH